MEGVSEETRLAYQNYKQRMEFSSRLDERSKELQTQVATMKNSPERDSLIQLSNSMSMESIRQWQSAQQQLQLAKADDPEIQTKAETAIATAKAAEPPSEPVVTSQELATVANPVRSDAVPTGESAARTGVSGNQSANTNRADRSEQPAGTQPATSGQVSAIKPMSRERINFRLHQRPRRLNRLPEKCGMMDRLQPTRPEIKLLTVLATMAKASV